MAPALNDEKATLVTKYKAMLKELIDQQPSGLRGHLAIALGKHKSFVSQITNPAYRVPIPAHDLQTIFDVCCLSARERTLFLRLYNKAHASDIKLSGFNKRVTTEIKISLPALNDPNLTREVNKMIRDFSERLIAMARSLDKPNS